MAEMKNGTNKGTNGPRKRVAGDPLARPGKLDIAKARKGLKKIVRENQQWLKEMANR